MELTTEFKNKVRIAVLAGSKNYGGSANHYAQSIGLNASIYSRLKSGEIEKIISDTQWLTLGREFDVSLKSENWKVARTFVYTEIESNINFCQRTSKSMILVDDCGIGKTFCARHIVRSLKNAFYFDCSQAKTKQQFIRQLAKTVGVDSIGRYVDVKNNLKYCLNNILDKPLIVLDEAGDLEHTAFLELKEMWNGTENTCAWYMMGADGLRAKINKGINNHKVGYAEIFDRFSDEFIKLVPIGKEDRTNFYKNLIGTVAIANTDNQSKVKQLVHKCISKNKSLRHLETLIKIGA